MIQPSRFIVLVACTRQAKAWAAEKVKTGANGVERKFPHGGACFDCYNLWQKALAWEFPSFADLAKAHADDPVVAAKVSKIGRIIKGQEQNVSDPESLCSLTAAEVSIERSYLVLNESELRTELGAQRLLRGQSRHLHTLQIPSESDPACIEEVFVFSNPAQPYRRAIVNVFVSSTAVRERMTTVQSFYEGQGRHALGNTWQSVGAGATKLLNTKLPTLNGFVADYRKSSGGAAAAPSGDASASGRAQARSTSKAGRGRSSDEGSGDDDSDNDEGGIVGIAASAIDLQTPTKSRPPVPLFGSGANAPSSARSAASGAVESEAPDDDDDEGADSEDGDGASSGESEAEGRAKGEPWAQGIAKGQGPKPNLCQVLGCDVACVPCVLLARFMPMHRCCPTRNVVRWLPCACLASDAARVQFRLRRFCTERSDSRGFGNRRLIDHRGTQ